MRRIVVTGISGCGFKNILEQIRSEGIEWMDMGDTMQAVAKEQGFSYEDMTILDSPQKELALLRSLAAERIMRHLESAAKMKSVQAFIVSLHATFKWRGVFVSGFSPHFINEFKPDVFVNIIDDLDRLKASLESNPKWAGQNMTWDDVLDWREMESFTTSLLASSIRSKFYVFAAQEPPEMLRKLILQPGIKKAYLSFSITHADPGDLDKVRSVRDRLRELMVVFDPYAIKENILQENIEIPSQTRERIGNLVVPRDYQLISQSDYVLVYYPGEKFSQGVASEIVYGFSSGKKVYIVWPHEAESPFLKYYRHESFKTLDQMMSTLEAEISPARTTRNPNAEL